MSQNTPSVSNHRTRKLLPYAGAALLVALIVAGLWPKPVPVELARVARGPLRATVNEEGKTRIKQRYVISAPVSGQLRRIDFKAGAEIKPVFLVEDRISAATIDALRAKAYEIRLVGGSAAVNGIIIDPSTGFRFGGADPRGNGYALGW